MKTRHFELLGKERTLVQYWEQDRKEGYHPYMLVIWLDSDFGASSHLVRVNGAVYVFGKISGSRMWTLSPTSDYRDTNPPIELSKRFKVAWAKLQLML